MEWWSGGGNLKVELRTFPPPEGVYKCTSVYKPIESRVCCMTSVYISVYEGPDMEEDIE